MKNSRKLLALSVILLNCTMMAQYVVIVGLRRKYMKIKAREKMRPTMENKYKSIPCNIELQETESGIWWKLKSQSREEAVIDINALALSSCVCGEPTGNAWRGEDSLYCEEHDSGPYCQKCFDNHCNMRQTQYMKRRAETIDAMFNPLKGGVRIEAD
jgi:hypothetical protein